MKKLYNEFFYVPKYGKVKEKVMLMRTALTVVIMVVCLFAMSLTAYAYFSHNVTSGSNIIKAAYFDAQITVNNGTNDVTLTKDGKYQTALLPAGDYSIKFERGSSTADTGFCVVTIGDTVYHTGQIGEDVARSVDGASVTFTLKVSTDTNIKILSHWGTSSKYGYGDVGNVSKYISDGDTLDLRVPDKSKSNSDTEKKDETGESDEPSGETTSQETTTGETTESTTTPTEVVYTVQSGDTLSGIAKQYNTTVTKIAAYNGISNPNAIVTGQKITIPPADYVVPIETTPETTATPETTTPPETTQNETEETTESQSTQEPSDTTEQTNPEDTTVTASEQETQPAETTGAPDTEETGGTI